MSNIEVNHSSHPSLNEASPWRFWLAVAIAAIVLIGAPAMLRPMFMPDEGRYGEVARQALKHGHWLIPYINGVPHLTKPPLFYDAAAVAMAALGRNAFAMRLPSLLCFAAMLIAAALWARERGGAAAGRLTALVLLTTLMPVAAAQFADLNMMLTAFVTVAMLWMFDGLDGRIGRWYAAWAMLGLAFLTKGPVALLFPAAALLGRRLWGGRLGGPRAIHWLGGAALTLVIALPWYAWTIHVIGDRMIEYWRNQMFHRTGVGGESKGVHLFFYYIPVFLVCTSLWGAYFIARGAKAVKARTGQYFSATEVWRMARELPAAEQFLLGCVAGTLLLFAAMRAKMPSYILPCMPAFGVLVALQLARQWGDGALRQSLVRRLIIGSGAMAYLGLWGYTGLMLFALHWPEAAPRRFAEDMHPNIIANLAAERMGDSPAIIQVDEFVSLVNFRAGANSILVDETIHDEWPGPPELVESYGGLARRIHAGEPLLIVVDDNNMKDVLPQGEHPNVRVLFVGESETLLSTLPRDLADPSLPRRAGKK